MYGYHASDRGGNNHQHPLAAPPSCGAGLVAGGEVGVNTPKVPDGQRSMICISPLASQRPGAAAGEGHDTPMSINFTEVFASPRLPTPRGSKGGGSSHHHRQDGNADDSTSLKPAAVTSALHTAERDMQLDDDLNALLQLAGNTTPGGRPTGLLSPLLSSSLRRFGGADGIPPAALQLPAIGGSYADPPPARLPGSSTAATLPRAKASNSGRRSASGKKRKSSDGGGRAHQPQPQQGGRKPQFANPDKVSTTTTTATGHARSSLVYPSDPAAAYRHPPPRHPYHHHPEAYPAPGSGHGNMVHSAAYPSAHPHYAYPDAAKPPGLASGAAGGGSTKRSRSRSRNKALSSAPTPTAPAVVATPKRRATAAALRAMSPMPPVVSKSPVKLAGSSSSSSSAYATPASTPAAPAASGKKGRSTGRKKTPTSKTKSEVTDPADLRRIDEAIRAVNSEYGSGETRRERLAQLQVRGVTQRPSGKWQAQVYYSGKSRYIGVFDSKGEASLAYEIAREVLKMDTAEAQPKGTAAVDRNVSVARSAAFAGAKNQA